MGNSNQLPHLQQASWRCQTAFSPDNHSRQTWIPHHNVVNVSGYYSDWENCRWDFTMKKQNRHCRNESNLCPHPLQEQFWNPEVCLQKTDKLPSTCLWPCLPMLMSITFLRFVQSLCKACKFLLALFSSLESVDEFSDSCLSTLLPWAWFRRVSVHLTSLCCSGKEQLEGGSAFLPSTDEPRLAWFAGYIKAAC